MRRLGPLFDALSAFFDVFRFIERRRRRREAELEALHQRNVELIDTILARIEKTEEIRANAMVESALGHQKMAEALQTWFEMFKFDSQDNSPAPTVRPEDEWAAERQREQQRLIEAGFPVDKPPDEQMAWVLANQF